jgi:hypothetical protein
MYHYGPKVGRQGLVRASGELLDLWQTFTKYDTCPKYHRVLT